MRTKLTVWALLLALVLTLSPALGAEAVPQFADVAPEAWYAQGVATCAEKGIMVGDGAGLFRTETRLTREECLALALRLYAPGKELEKAPEDWGKITLTLADGHRIVLYGDDISCRPSPIYYSKAEPGSLESVEMVYGVILSALSPEDAGRLKANEGPVTWEDSQGSQLEMTYISSFSTEEQAGYAPMAGGDISIVNAPGPDKWWRDVFYTAQVWGLAKGETPGIQRLMEYGGGWWASREEFAQALWDTVKAEGLPKRVTVDDIPDETFYDGYYLKSLYEGGILNGVDEYGAFDGGAFLTRAQAAVMAARLLDEGQRLDKPVKALPSDRYTLAETAETWEQVYGNKPEESRPSMSPKQGADGLYGYVDPEGEWVIIPTWKDAQGFLDGYAVVWDGTGHYAIDDMGHIVLGQAYTSLFNLGEGKFLGEWLDSGTGYVREVRDARGRAYPSQYGDKELWFQNGFAVYQPFGTSRGFYLDDAFRPVSGKFDRCGALDENLSGLVELDGKTYRIQFD